MRVSRRACTADTTRMHLTCREQRRAPSANTACPCRSSCAKRRTRGGRRARGRTSSPEKLWRVQWQLASTTAHASCFWHRVPHAASARAFARRLTIFSGFHTLRPTVGATRQVLGARGVALAGKIQRAVKSKRKPWFWNVNDMRCAMWKLERGKLWPLAQRLPLVSLSALPVSRRLDSL